MTRRFVTVEDVRRSQGGEILVDETTVVTPQALEAARAAGVTIRSAAGPYREPEPDRGPDAARASWSLPHLPEPAGAESTGGTGIVLTAVGRNRAGVLAEITAALAELSVDVHEISQRIIEGYFHLVLTAHMTDPQAFGSIKDRLQCMGGEEDYVVRVLHQRVFRFMHRV